MADYKQMYLTLLDEVENTIQKLTEVQQSGAEPTAAIENVIQDLISVQRACEEIYIETE